MSSLAETNPWAIDMANLPQRILLILLVTAAAFAIGFFLRRQLVERLKKTVLDTWIIQTLGVLVFIPPLIVAMLAGPIVLTWSFQIFIDLLRILQETFNFTPATLSSLGGNILKTTLLVTLGMGAARTIRKVTVGGLGESRIDLTIRTLIGRILFILIIVFAAFWILSVWDVSLGIPVAFIGVITVAITVSIQDVLKDLAAGFYILIERPFSIGNTITIPSGAVIYTGKVEDVQLRATKLRLVSGEEVSIPNSVVFSSVVTNSSCYSERRAAIAVTLSQEEFRAGETEVQLLAILKENQQVMPKPEPSILFTSYAEKKITLTLRFWITTEQPATVSEVMQGLYTTLPGAELAVKEFAGNV
jgi:small-conductance mechanosensitive channel